MPRNSSTLLVPKLYSALVALVPKLYLGTQLSEKLRFEEHAPGATEAQLPKHIRSQVQLGNEKDEKAPISYLRLRSGALVSLVIALAFLLVAAQGAFAAESFDTRLARARDTLLNDDPDGALTIYRELQTEDPESEVLYYNMGCAQYQQGVKLIKEKAPQDAVESFKTAKKSFEKVENARDPEIRKRTQYNHANATAQIAINSAEAQQYKESLEAFDQSVKEYRAFLKQYPDDKAALQGLIHTLYEYQKRLQNPPPPQQGKGEQNKDQNKDQNQKQDQQKDQQQQDQQQKEGEDKKQDEQAGQEKQQEKQQQEQQQAGAECAKPNEKDQKDQQKESADNPQPECRQDVEAILESLEDTDKREQKETKNVRTDIKIGKDWW